MLNIAICDDDSTQLGLLFAYTQECIQTNAIHAVIHQFDHPDKLLLSCEKQQYHLYILDIVMPMINGLEVGKDIRKRDQEAIILYATYEPGFALQSFESSPINYLLKPIDKQLLCKTLLQAFSKLDKASDSSCTVKTAEGVRVLRFAEILIAEYSNHTVQYTLTNARIVETCIIKGSFSDHTQSLLQDKRFIRSHVSYILNMDYIEGFTKTRFTLHGGYEVPIVAKLYRSVRERYLEYLLMKEST
ncbi:MAG TPA: LytTR family DNA-binding domain-containing protein [Sphaerochaeta sp.]|nr:LytTR family DNA-binding domain-containing protein [Sphaerochaeta sp.]